MIQGDSDFQGVAKLHTKCETPKKKSSPDRGGKANNRRIAKERILIENSNAKPDHKRKLYTVRLKISLKNKLKKQKMRIS
jgi:hypothetical protein